MSKNKLSEAVPNFETTIMGERGQIVIPKGIRETAGLKTGDKFIVFAPHDHALVLVPMNKAQEIMNLLKRRMSFIEKNI